MVRNAALEPFVKVTHDQIFANCMRSDAIFTVGDETYDPSTNSCAKPNCKGYYFSHIDTATSTCVYSNTAYGFGVAFIIAVTIMEVLSFFTMQYSAAETIRYDYSTFMGQF